MESVFHLYPSKYYASESVMRVLPAPAAPHIKRVALLEDIVSYFYINTLAKYLPISSIETMNSGWYKHTSAGLVLNNFVMFLLRE